METGDPIFEKIVIAGISSLIGALVAYVGAALKNSLDTKQHINELLLEKRTEQYQIIWDKSRLLPKWPRDESVTYKDLKELSAALRDWYFDGGGIYLSRKSQKLYAKVQEVIDKTYQGKKDGPINCDNSDKNRTSEYDIIRKAFSTLRTSMTDDLHSRRGAPTIDISKLWKKG